MDPSHITQQTTTTLPLQGELSRDAPQPKALRDGSFSGKLQWALEGPGWGLLRPTVDFVLLWVAVVFALEGLHETLHPSGLRAPILLLPFLVMLLLFLRGLYRSRLRVLILDGLVPVISSVSIAAMAVAMVGLFANGRMAQSTWIRAWLFGLVAVGAGRVILSVAQRSARSRAPSSPSALTYVRRP